MRQLFILLLLFSLDKYGLSQNPRKELPVGLNIQLGGSALIGGVSIDAFVIPAINLELGTGFFTGQNYFGGVKFHTESESNSNWSLYGGAMIIVTKSENDFLHFINGKKKYYGLAYLPIGIQYISDRGFTFGFEFAGLIDKDLAIYDNQLMPYFGINLGIHFSLKDDLPKPEKRKSNYKDENFEYHID